MRCRRLMYGLLVGLLLLPTLGGCSSPPKPGPPPMKVSFRKSQVPTQGMVAGVNNTSATDTIMLSVVCVQGKKDTEGRSYRLNKRIKPLDSITVGWLQLDAWELKPGDKLRFQCEGYTEEFACQVPD